MNRIRLLFLQKANNENKIFFFHIILLSHIIQYIVFFILVLLVILYAISYPKRDFFLFMMLKRKYNKHCHVLQQNYNTIIYFNTYKIYFHAHATIIRV